LRVREILTPLATLAGMREIVMLELEALAALCKKTP
jgi:hypothetical protein